MKVRIVLVEPHEAGNVGAAARAMKNFGYTDLVIVGKRSQRRDDVSIWWASGAVEVMEDAPRLPTLEEALTDCHLSVATTAVRDRHVFERLTPAAVSDLAWSTLTDDQTVALVFGREEWGLTVEEIATCQRTAVIPTSPEFPTMNLAQSVAIFCYEMAKGLRPSPSDREPAIGAVVQQLQAHSRKLLHEVSSYVGYKPEKLYAELNALIGRSMLTTREASLLLSVIRDIERRIGIDARIASDELE